MRNRKLNLKVVSIIGITMFCLIASCNGGRMKLKKQKLVSWLGPQRELYTLPAVDANFGYKITLAIILGKNIKINPKAYLLVCTNGKLHYLKFKEINSIKLDPERKYIYCTMVSKDGFCGEFGMVKVQITEGYLKGVIVAILNAKRSFQFNQALYLIPQNVSVKTGQLSFKLYEAQYLKTMITNEVVTSSEPDKNYKPSKVPRF